MNQPEERDPGKALSAFLLYAFIPMWTAAGTLDWYCHKETDIEHTSGTKEALLHILMQIEAGVPTTLALLFEINAAVLAAMAAGLVLHEATVWWDVGYAVQHRETPAHEQHVHSFLEVLPFMGFAMAACLNPEQLTGKPDFTFRLKRKTEGPWYWAAVTAMILGGGVVPYVNELWRCLRAQKEPKKPETSGELR